VNGPTRAVVLRATPYRDHDLVVDLLGEDTGRVAALARSARRSQRRFGGALEVGTRLSVRLTPARRGSLAGLGDCDVLTPLHRIRSDLDRFHHLAYVVEVARLVSREGEADATGYGLVAGYLDALEAGPATAEGLALWELAMLSHHGYALRLDACVVTGQRPDGLSLEAGGAVRRAAARARDAVSVPGEAVAALDALARGLPGARLAPAHQPAVRRALAALWAGVAGRPLRSAPFVPVDPE
jgi:DNA repair protein RecO